jgi:hypothetical protein
MDFVHERTGEQGIQFPVRHHGEMVFLEITGDMGVHEGRAVYDSDGIYARFFFHQTGLGSGLGDGKPPQHDKR